MLVSPLLPSFLDTYSLSTLFLDQRTRKITTIQYLPCSPVNLFKFFPRPPEEWYRVSYKRDSPGTNSFDEILAEQLGFEKLFRSSEKLLLFFLSSPLVWWCLLPIFLSTCKFLIKRSVFFLLFFIWQFSSFCHLSFPTSHNWYGTFFYAKLLPYIVTVYPNCLN